MNVLRLLIPITCVLAALGQSATLAATGDPVWQVAERYGPWAALAIWLIYQQGKERTGMILRIAEIENYQRNTMQGLVERSTVAIESVSGLMKGCAHRDKSGKGGE